MRKNFRKKRLIGTGVCSFLSPSPPGWPVVQPSPLTPPSGSLARADYLVRRQKIYKVGSSKDCGQSLCREGKLGRPGEKMRG